MTTSKVIADAPGVNPHSEEQCAIVILAVLPARLHAAPRREAARASQAPTRKGRASNCAARSSTERSDRLRFRKGSGRFRRRAPEMTFESWLVSTPEGRELLALRRERNPRYAENCNAAVSAPVDLVEQVRLEAAALRGENEDLRGELNALRAQLAGRGGDA